MSIFKQYEWVTIRHFLAKDDKYFIANHFDFLASVRQLFSSKSGLTAKSLTVNKFPFTHKLTFWSVSGHTTVRLYSEGGVYLGVQPSFANNLASKASRASSLNSREYADDEAVMTPKIKTESIATCTYQNGKSFPLSCKSHNEK